MSKVKIFSIYYSKQNLFHGKAIKTDIIEPIQTGKAATGWDLGILSDDTGDNISSKNPYYGELTCWYWVWKNWLPQHPECEYIGFTQYRRMLQLGEDRKVDRRKVVDSYLVSVTKKDFIKIVKTISYDNIKNYDLVLPYRMSYYSTNEDAYKRYALYYRPELYDLGVKLLLQQGETVNNIDKLRNSLSGYHKCNFIMTAKLFIECMEWLFNFLFKLEIFDNKFNGYNATNKGNRAAAYITEYFINLFYLSLIERKLRIKEAMLYEARFYKKLIKDEIDMRKFKKTNYWREYVPKNIIDCSML